jgi:hypothetical protein
MGILTEDKVKLPHPPAPTDVIVFWWLKLVVGVYMVAFWSFHQQVLGLVGEKGILPAQGLIGSLRMHLGAEGWLQYPTVFWWIASDQALDMGFWFAYLIGVLAICGILQRFAFIALWILYLSYANVAQIFMGYQWDALLLEVGFISILMAPNALVAFSPPKVSKFLIWLPRLILLKLMVQAGLVKWLSGDEVWRNFTALEFHYMTQPLPNGLSWMFHHFSQWMHKFGVIAMFFIELILPVFMFLGRVWRWLAFLGLLLLQVLIMISGNYGFFNLLSIVLCFSLLDDNMFVTAEEYAQRTTDVKTAQSYERLNKSVVAEDKRNQPLPMKDNFWTRDVKRVGKIPVMAQAFLCGLAVIINGVFLINTFPQYRANMPGWVQSAMRSLQVYRIAGSYGLFAMMTKDRPEIIIEGSEDGEAWLAYQFKFKPVYLQDKPEVAGFHMPRLDWQMWFAALKGDYRRSQWYMAFMQRLLEGSPDVTALLHQESPWLEIPPKFIRSRMYRYEFTSQDEFHDSKGDIWKRTYLGEYTPVLSLPDGHKSH